MSKCEIGIIQSDNELLEIIFNSTLDVSSGLSLLGGKDLVSFTSSALLDLSLDLLKRLSLGGLLAQDLLTTKLVDGFVLNKILLVFVGVAEASCSVTSENGSESEENQVLGVPAILVSDEILKFFLGNGGFALMIDIKEEFLSG